MSTTTIDLLVKGQYILPLDQTAAIIENGAIAIHQGQISAIGPAADLEKKYPAREIIDAGYSLVLPGLINTHTHAAMTGLRGIADDLPLSEWLEKYIWPAEARLIRPEFVRAAARLACLEMIKAGITCFNDMYFFEDITGEEAVRAGVRAVLGEAILDFPTPSAKTPAESLRQTEELIAKFRNEELIGIAVAPHSVYTCSQDTLLAAKALADRHGKLLHIHLNETRKESADARERFGQEPAEYLEKIGFFGGSVIAAHCVWLTENERKILRERGVGVSHNPRSNQKLASGIAPIAELLAQGILVSLGTDGTASNNVLDIFAEIQAASLAQKAAKLDPAVIPALTALRMAANHGAAVLGLASRIGSLAPGKAADLITIDLDQPHLTPLYNPYSHLAYCVRAGDVSDVIINGRVIMRKRQVLTLDETAVLAEIRQLAK